MSTWSDWQPWIADAMVVVGVLAMTAGIIGMVRMPDIYTKIHAVGKAVFLGAVLLVLSSLLIGDVAITYRTVLIAVLLLVTTPVSAHVIAEAAWRTDKHHTIVTEWGEEEID